MSIAMTDMVVWEVECSRCSHRERLMAKPEQTADDVFAWLLDDGWAGGDLQLCHLCADVPDPVPGEVWGRDAGFEANPVDDVEPAR